LWAQLPATSHPVMLGSLEAEPSTEISPNPQENERSRIGQGKIPSPALPDLKGLWRAELVPP
jgi:hypothetical protein